MRNLKKVLSLALAMVMLLGMMVVGASAKTSFKDDSDIPENRQVAASVANQIGVLVGDDDKNFLPNGTLTRAEAAVILARLDLGASAASALTATDAATFTDVVPGSGYNWAKPFIDYCAGNGYMLGVGNNRFAPGETLTSVQFGLMISRVLGYRDANEGITGDNWEINAAALARKAGLGNDVAVDSKDMSRADMAQMVLNALQAPMVEYGDLNISVGDVSITSKATNRTHSNDEGTGYDYKGDRIQPNITPIRLCEEKYPTLKLNRDGENDFKEAYSAWTYRGVEIEGSQTALSYYSTTKSESDTKWMPNVEDIYTSCKVYVNGYNDTNLDDLIMRPSDINKLTGNGRKVEVYVDPDDLATVEKVVVIDTVAGEVTKVDEENTLTIKLLGTDSLFVKGGTGKLVVKNDLLTAKADKVDGEFKKGDLVLLRAYDSKDDYFAIDEEDTVDIVFAPEKVEEFVVRKNYDKAGKAKSIDTAETTGIEDAHNVLTDFNIAAFEVNNKNQNSTLYKDEYGYIVKIDGWQDTTPYDGLIAVKDKYQDVEGRKIVDRVSGVIANGETIELACTNLSEVNVGRIYTYAKDGSAYKLTLVADQATLRSTLGSATDHYVANKWTTDKPLNFRSNDVRGNVETYAKTYYYADTVKFIFADDVNDEVTVMNGRQNYDSKTLRVVAQALNKDNEIIAVFVEAEPDFVDLDDIIFVWKKKSSDTVVGSDKQTIYYGYEAYKSDGTEIPDFFGTTGTMDKNTANLDGKFYKEDTIKDGDIIAYKPNDNGTKLATHTLEAMPIDRANGTRGDSFTIDGKEYLTNSRTKIVDLATKVIETPAELNQTMNKDRKAVTVALVYTEDTVNNTRDLHTIFVTKVGATGSFDGTHAPDLTGYMTKVLGNITVRVPNAWLAQDVNARVIGDEIRVSFKAPAVASITAGAATVESQGFDLGDAGDWTNTESPDANGVYKVVFTANTYTKDESYVVTLPGTVATYNVKVTSVPTGYDLTKASTDPTSMAATGGGIALKLKLDAADVTAVDTVDITFSVKNATVKTLGTNVTDRGTGRYVKTGVSVSTLTGAGAEILSQVVANGNGPVEVSVEGIKDVSTRVGVQFVLDSASEANFEMTAPTGLSVTADTAGTVNASAGAIHFKKANIKSANVTYIVNGIATSEQVHNDAVVDGANLNAAIKVPATAPGKTITVTVHVEANTYAKAIRVVKTGTTTGTAETELIFDKNGEVTEDGILSAGATNNNYYLVEINGKEVGREATGSAVTLVAGDFTLTQSELLSPDKLVVTVTEYAKITTVTDNEKGGTNTADVITGATAGKYFYSIAPKNGESADIRTFGTRDEYIAVGEKYTVTVLWDNTQATTKDTITVTATGHTVGSTADTEDLEFLKAEQVTGASKSVDVTIKGGAAVVIKLTGTNS